MFWWLLRYLPDKKSEEGIENVLFQLHANSSSIRELAANSNSEDIVSFILESIEGLESLKRTYWEHGMKRVRNVVIKTISMLKKELKEIQANRKTVAQFLEPLILHGRSIPGVEVKVSDVEYENVSIIVNEISSNQVEIQTLGRHAITTRRVHTDTLSRVFRQSRRVYANLFREAIWKNEPRVCSTISAFLFYKLIPIEIHLPVNPNQNTPAELSSDEGFSRRLVVVQPEYFPVSWALVDTLDQLIPKWRQQYFSAGDPNQAQDLHSTPHLVSVDEHYLQAMHMGRNKFIFRLHKGTKDHTSPHHKITEASQSRRQWDNIYPYNRHESARFLDLNRSLMQTCSVPDPGLEHVIDKYVNQNFSQFPFKALYVSAIGISKYRNLAIRVESEQPGVFRKTLEMLQRGHSWEGDRKLSACQYVIKSNQLEVFHQDKPPPLGTKCTEDPTFFTQTSELFPDTAGASIQSMKDRNVWKPIYGNMTGLDPMSGSAWNEQSKDLQSMFEVFAYYGLNYIGAPIRSPDSGLPIGVVCLLHNNDYRKADEWEGASKVVSVANSVADLFGARAKAGSRDLRRPPPGTSMRRSRKNSRGRRVRRRRRRDPRKAPVKPPVNSESSI